MLHKQDYAGKNPFAQAKKWAASIMYQLFHRYGVPMLADDDHKAFAEQFQSTYASKVTEVCPRAWGG